MPPRLVWTTALNCAETADFLLAAAEVLAPSGSATPADADADDAVALSASAERIALAVTSSSWFRDRPDPHVTRHYEPVGERGADRDRSGRRRGAELRDDVREVSHL